MAPGLIAPAASALAENRLEVSTPGLTVEIARPTLSEKRGGRDGSKDALGQSGAPFAIHEIVPGDESVEAWTTLFAVLIEEGIGFDLETCATQLVAVCFRACAEAPLVEVLGGAGDTPADLSIVCAAYADDPATGEIAQFALRRSGDDFPRAYQHWRLPATGLSEERQDALRRDMSLFWDSARAMTITRND